MRFDFFVRYAGCAAVSAVLAVTLAACSFDLPSKKVEYKSAGKLPSTLDVPPDLVRPSADDRYNVPDARRGAVSANELKLDQELGNAAPQASGVLPEVSDAHIERAGSQRWLVVKGDPATVWPAVKDFWQEAGLLINSENEQAGVMETDWLESRANVSDGPLRRLLGNLLDSVYVTATRDKFRSRLEAGQDGTTEIYISHRGFEEVYITEGSDKTRWQPRKPDPDLEAEMLRRLLVRFGVQQERAKQQVARQAIEASQGQGQATRSGDMLTLNEPFDRAWRRVGLALDRVGFTVEDRDRSKGLYFVRYIDPDAAAKPEEKRGLFTRMADGIQFWKSSDSAKKSEQFQVSVKDLDTTAQVNVLSKEGRAEKSPTVTRIVGLLYDQLK